MRLAVIVSTLSIILVTLTLQKIYADYKPDFDIITKYCLDNAQRVAAGENVVNDLVSSGLLSHFWQNQTCSDARNNIVTNNPNATMEASVEDFMDNLMR